MDTRGAPASLLGPLAERGFAALLGIGTAYAIIFGLVEIGLTAFAAEAGRPALAGGLLGVMALDMARFARCHARAAGRAHTKRGPSQAPAQYPASPWRRR